MVLTALLRNISAPAFLLSHLFAFSTDALAEAKKALAATGDIQNLRRENLALFKDNQKLKEDLEATKMTLAETQKSAKEQADRDTESIRLLQDNLEAHLAETTAIDDELLSKCRVFLLLTLLKFS